MFPAGRAPVKQYSAIGLSRGTENAAGPAVSPHSADDPPERNVIVPSQPSRQKVRPRLSPRA
jgi:hypothetical protein